MKKTILVDFDGVIHLYSKGWHDGTAYDGPMPGAREALEKLREKYEVVIFTTREPQQVFEWLGTYGFDQSIEITNHKRPASCLIDDRAVRFTNWNNTFKKLEEYYGL